MPDRRAPPASAGLFLAPFVIARVAAPPSPHPIMTPLLPPVFPVRRPPFRHTTSPAVAVPFPNRTPPSCAQYTRARSALQSKWRQDEPKSPQRGSLDNNRPAPNMDIVTFLLRIGRQSQSRRAANFGRHAALLIVCARNGNRPTLTAAPHP